MPNRININPNEKFDNYKKKFDNDYCKFLEKISENIKIVDHHINSLNCTIVPLKNPDELRAQLEKKYNQTNYLLNVLCPMIKDDEVKYLHIFPFDKKYSELMKNDETTFKLVQDMYFNLTMATRWEAESIHYKHTGKPVDLKWTKNTIAKITQDRIDLAGKNNAEHTLFKSTLDRRISNDKE